jgi:hypothetical protein
MEVVPHAGHVTPSFEEASHGGGSAAHESPLRSSSFLHSSSNSEEILGTSRSRTRSEPLTLQPPSEHGPSSAGTSASRHCS